jgi:hypothetical protein
MIHLDFVNYLLGPVVGWDLDPDPELSEQYRIGIRNKRVRIHNTAERLLTYFCSSALQLTKLRGPRPMILDYTACHNQFQSKRKKDQFELKSWASISRLICTKSRGKK